MAGAAAVARDVLVMWAAVNVIEWVSRAVTSAATKKR